MTELKWICVLFSLTLLLSLAVEGALNIDQKWGNHFGYEGGLCLPGLCIRGAGGSNNYGDRPQYRGGSNFYGGRNQYGGGDGYRETMYCKPLTCWGGSCDALHLHIDKALYKSLISKNKEAKHSSTVDYNIPETLKHNVNKNYEFKEVKEAAMAPQSS